jgi:hypothetical protein
MKQESLKGQKSLFQEESYASYVPEENARYNGKFVCIMDILFYRLAS